MEDLESYSQTEKEASEAELQKAKEAYDNEDYQTALSIWETWAERGYADAMCYLGECYYYGRGTTQDYAIAVKWYRKAANLGDVDAMKSLGYCYINGQGITQDLTKAAKWCRKAANLGDVDAMNNLGVCYQYSDGASQDDTKAIKWYHKAADLGHVDAMANLAKLLFETDKIDEAAEWARKSLDNGYEDEDGTIENIIANKPNNQKQSKTNKNNQNLQNENHTDGAVNNTNGHKITFLELFLNILSFAIISGCDDGGYKWWVLILGAIISVVLSWMFDAEKYDRLTYVITFIGVFIVSILVFAFIELPAWTWLIIWPTLYTIMVKIISRIKAAQTTCDNCKKEYAMEVYDTKFLRSESISIRKEEWITDVYGKQHKNAFYVPGTRCYYKDLRRCKYCGYEDFVQYSTETEN